MIWEPDVDAGAWPPIAFRSRLAEQIRQTARATVFAHITLETQSIQKSSRGEKNVRAF